MRWPWSRAIPAGAAQPPGRSVAAARGEAGWAYLPPLQRTIADAPRITAPHDLAAWRSPAFTGRMSHAVSPSAPSGIVDADGLGVPSVQAPALELPLLIPPHEAPAPVAQRMSDAAAPQTLVPRLPEAHVVAPASGAPSLTVSRAVEVPLPLARAIAAEPVAATPAPSMSQREVPTPALPVADAAVLGDEPLPAEAADGTLLPDNGGATEVALPRPAHLPPVSTPLASPQRPTVAETSRTLPAVQRAAEPQATRPAAPRRLGLGAPLPSLPVAQRAVAETPATSTVADAAPVTAGSPDAADAPAVPAEPPRPAAPPALPVQRAAAAEAPVAQPPDLPAVPEHAHPAEAPVLGERPAEPAALITAPVAAGEPVPAPDLPAMALPLPEPERETVPATPTAPPGVQREVELIAPLLGAAAGPAAQPVAAPAPRALPMQRVADLLGARTVPLHVSPSLTPQPRARAGVPATAAAGAATAAVQVPVQRAVLLPPPAPSLARASAAPHLLSARAVAPELVPEPATVPPVPAPAPPALDPPLPIQRLLDSAPLSPTVLAPHRDQLRLPVAVRPQLAVDQATTVATLQREAAEAAEAAAEVPEPAGEAVPEPAPALAISQSTATPAPPASAASSPEELDKLAARLVEPLTRRIKAEMIIDRERRGLRSDPR